MVGAGIPFDEMLHMFEFTRMIVYMNIRKYTYKCRIEVPMSKHRLDFVIYIYIEFMFFNVLIGFRRFFVTFILFCLTLYYHFYYFHEVRNEIEEIMYCKCQTQTSIVGCLSNIAKI